MEDNNTNLHYQSTTKLCEGAFVYAELELIITQEVLDTFAAYPARIAFQTVMSKSTNLYIDDIKVEFMDRGITPNAYFDDETVFQQGKPLKVWGSGLVDVALGGSKIETWLSRETLESRSEYTSKVAELDEKIANDDYINSKIAAADYKYIPNALYNSMYSPFKHIIARGMIWYQGESNTSTSTNPYYDLMLEDLINQYRNDQNNPDFHVFSVILAPYQYSADFPIVRQYTFDVSKRMKNVYPISTSNEGPNDYDYGISNAIHPTNKIPVGNRLYLAAKANVYKELNYTGTWNGPLYDSMVINGNKAVLKFKQVGEGLKTVDGGALKGFKTSADGITFVDASAQIVGDTVEVWADSVSTPKEVRYCYVNISDDKETLGGNLTNETNILAIPFRASLAAFNAEKTVDNNKV